MASMWITRTFRPEGQMSGQVPVLFYDAGCGFCRSWIARWRRGTGERIRYVPYQRRAARWKWGIRKRDARQAAQLVDRGGRRSSGAAAMLGALRYAPAPWIRLLARIGLSPGVRSLAERAYRFIARHRTGASRVQRGLQRLFAHHPPRGRIWRALSRPQLALRGVGVVYVIAFASLRRQVLGLYGSRGIRPVRQSLDQVARQLPAGPGGPVRMWLRRLRIVPSLLWFAASDRALVNLCRLGQIAGAALAFGIAPRAAAWAAWCAYLSFVSTGREFLGFQWDALLLESGLVAAVGGRHRRGLMRLLAVRLQFESGIAKLASGDPTWRDLTACAYHQETQPLPTPVGWYTHHLPRRMQQAASALTLSVEIAVPALAFGPPRAREVAFAALTGFQALIGLTGNFAFFNCLTAVLNLTIVEERPAPTAVHRPVIDALESLASGTLIGLATLDIAQRVWPGLRVPRFLDRLSAAFEPMHAVNSYGLFAMMTTRRLEIVIEGSEDGETWCEYGFRYKPGDIKRAPRWVAPHQPRLDWQMWFASLRSPPTWFPRLLQRLLEGSPDVLALLGENPFPSRPPRYVRALLYDYRIADLNSHRQTGIWWTRTRAGIYFPACTISASSSATGSSRS